MATDRQFVLDRFFEQCGDDEQLSTPEPDGDVDSVECSIESDEKGK